MALAACRRIRWTGGSAPSPCRPRPLSPGRPGYRHCRCQIARCRSPARAGPGRASGRKVNRQPLAARRGRFEQLQRAVEQGHVPVRRDNIGAVGLERYAVRNFEDPFGYNALPVRLGLLLWSGAKCCTSTKAMPGRSGGYAGKKGSKGRESPGRCADADSRGILGHHAQMAAPLLSVRGFLPRPLHLAPFCRHADLLPFPVYSLASGLCWNTFRELPSGPSWSHSRPSPASVQW